MTEPAVSFLKVVMGTIIGFFLAGGCLVATFCAPSPDPNHEWNPREWESCDRRCEAMLSTDEGLVGCKCWCNDGHELYVCDEEVVGVGDRDLEAPCCLYARQRNTKR